MSSPFGGINRIKFLGYDLSPGIAEGHPSCRAVVLDYDSTAKLI